MGATRAQNIQWEMAGAKFRFADHDAYAEWSRDRHVWFYFDPKYTDDGGESIFSEPRLADLYFPITDKNGSLEIDFEEDGPVISARVSFYVPLVSAVDQEALEKWVLENGGWSSATIDIDNDDVLMLHECGTDWRLLRHE